MSTPEYPTRSIDSGARRVDPSVVSARSGSSSPPALLEQPGSLLGPYRLLSVLGEGGFGVVYLAEQEHPVRRRVALKLIKPGMDSKAVIARFEQERQALAMMDHPSVARVFDAGQTDAGRPFFVMEHVAGESITAYADRHKLSLRQRLELFVPVCEAVQHAHTKGIIHRDLKPSNVLVELVDAKPLPKVIDFGVAKAMSQRLTEKTIFTEQGVIIGTPEYMSPEQAEMGALDVDTRTDVYSLGVMLYELLTGVLPFEPAELRSAGYGAIQKIIREVDPPRPSARLTGLAQAPDPGPRTARRIAADRGTSPDALARALRRELEWIPVKAMRKDRAERYKSPADLAEDIVNYLAGKPLQAGPESGLYLARKFVKRHKAAVGASAAVLFLLAGSSVVMGALLAQTRAAERRTAAALADARTQAAKSKAVSDFVSDMLRSADPGRDGRQVKVASLLDKAGPAAERAAADQPETAASLHEILGATYRGLGLYEDAARHFRQCLALREKTLGPDHPDTFASMGNLAPVLRALGKWEEAEPLLARALEGLRATRGPEHRDTLVSLANSAQLLHERGKPAEGLERFRQAADAGLRVLPDNDDQLPMWLAQVALLLTDQGKFDEARPYADKALERSRRTLGNDHPTTQFALNVLARWHQARGEFADAEKLYKEAFDAGLKVLGPEHPSTLYWMNDYARILQDQRKFEEVLPVYEALVEIQARVVGAEHPDTLMLTNNLARGYQDLKRFDEAEPLMRRVVEIGRRTITIEHPNCMIWQNNLAKLLELKGDPAAAEPLYAEVVASARTHLPQGGTLRPTLELNWGNCLAQLRRFEQAEPLLVDAERALSAMLPAGHPQLKPLRLKLAQMYEQWGKPDQAREWTTKAGD
jgi:non-specific serine/threonine protein kinase/serine/threonine-protein kinase